MEFLRRIKLRNKIFLLCAALVLLTTVVIQANSWWSSNHFNQKQLQTQIENAKAVLKQYLRSQEALLVTAAKVLTADFGFIRAVATSDNPTIKSALVNHGNRIDADVMALTDMSGRVITSSTDDLSLQHQLSQQDVQKLINNPSKAMFITLGANLYQLILTPVRAPHVIAYNIVGFEIDQKTVSDLRTLTGLDISFYEGDRQLNSSSIRADSFKHFLQALHKQTRSWLMIQRPAYLTEQINLDSASAKPVGVLLISSLAPLYAQYDQLFLNNTALALLVALLASLISIVFARGLTVPLQKLAGLAKDYAKGHYLKSVELVGGEEVVNLQRSFRDMGLEIKQREDKILYQATYDALTGLPNQQTVKQSLDSILQPGSRFIVLAFSIHNFRQINDRLGGDIADTCLQALAERMQTMAQQTLLLGRLEGAEFFVTFSFDTSRRPVEIVDEYLSQLETAFTVADLNIKLDLHAGVTLYPENGQHAETILRRTSIALDSARQNKQRLHYYEDGEDEANMQRLAMMEALRQVILAGGQDQLFMVYQPKVSLNGDDMLRMEALLRWRRANNDFVSPEVFVNLAEEASLIIDLTRWVFDTVMAQLADWHRQGDYISAAVNVSAQDLAHPEFEEFVMQCCDKYQIPPKYITLEITERDIMHDEASAVMSLRSLKKAGFSIAIDDYGIGQSSLSKLKGLPVDEIKLDKSFIMYLDQSPKDQLIVRSTIELAHGLGYSVVAEGVENLESLSILRQLHCDHIQGYYISKPLAADVVTQWQKSYVEENTPSTYQSEPGYRRSS